MSGPIQNRRVLSGMRPSGLLHLGNYHGALKNWIELQYQYECFFFIADWHALTTGYEETARLEEYVWTMAIDWLAAGLNPGVATLFVQSRVPEHAELHLLLSMITPLGWLERQGWIPQGSFADQCFRIYALPVRLLYENSPQPIPDLIRWYVTLLT